MGRVSKQREGRGSAKKQVQKHMGKEVLLDSIRKKERQEEILRQKPDDKSEWLVYADILLEMGDARGEFIVVQETGQKVESSKLRELMQIRGKFWNRFSPESVRALEWMGIFSTRVFVMGHSALRGLLKSEHAGFISGKDLVLGFTPGPSSRRILEGHNINPDDVEILRKGYGVYRLESTLRDMSMQLARAIENGDMDSFKVLIRKGTNFHDNVCSSSWSFDVKTRFEQKSLLYLAVEKRQQEMVKTLIGLGVDLRGLQVAGPMLPQFRGLSGFEGFDRSCWSYLKTTAVAEAIHQYALTMDEKEYHTLELLLDYGANPNEKIFRSGGTVFSALTLLLHDRSDSSPGFLKRIVGLLLHHGADPNIQDDRMRTPLMNLALRKNKDVVNEIGAAENLIDHGADLNAIDEQGMSALMHAASNGRTDLMRLFAKSGADADIKDYNGMDARMHHEEWERKQDEG